MAYGDATAFNTLKLALDDPTQAYGLQGAAALQTREDRIRELVDALTKESEAKKVKTPEYIFAAIADALSALGGSNSRQGAAYIGQRQADIKAERERAKNLEVQSRLDAIDKQYGFQSGWAKQQYDRFLNDEKFQRDASLELAKNGIDVPEPFQKHLPEGFGQIPESVRTKTEQDDLDKQIATARRFFAESPGGQLMAPGSGGKRYYELFDEILNDPEVPTKQEKLRKIQEITSRMMGDMTEQKYQHELDIANIREAGDTANLEARSDAELRKVASKLGVDMTESYYVNEDTDTMIDPATYRTLSSEEQKKYTRHGLINAEGKIDPTGRQVLINRITEMEGVDKDQQLAAISMATQSTQSVLSDLDRYIEVLQREAGRQLSPQEIVNAARAELEGQIDEWGLRGNYRRMAGLEYRKIVRALENKFGIEPGQTWQTTSSPQYYPIPARSTIGMDRDYRSSSSNIERYGAGGTRPTTTVRTTRPSGPSKRGKYALSRTSEDEDYNPSTLKKESKSWKKKYEPTMVRSHK